MKVLFFGSTSDSVIVLDKIKEFTVHSSRFTVAAVITQPPRPIGRKQIMTTTPVEAWAKEHGITVLNFETNKEKPWLYANENQVIDALQPFKTDLIISACYGQKIPSSVIEAAKYGGLNVHPSLLPRWRGGDPIPWTIFYGDRQTGVTVVRLTDMFDAGEIIAQKKINLRGDEYPDPLRTKLFTIGAEMLVNTIANIFKGTSFKKGSAFSEGQPYARRLRREDGFVSWELIEIASSPAVPRNDIATTIQPNFAKLSPNAQATGDTALGKQINENKENDPTSPRLRMAGKLTNATKQQIKQLSIFKSVTSYELPTTNYELALMIERMVRAFTPWPGMWTYPKIKIYTAEKRLKILSAHLTTTNHQLLTTNLVLDTLQLEGKNPTTFEEFKSAYLQH